MTIVVSLVCYTNNAGFSWMEHIVTSFKSIVPPEELTDLSLEFALSIKSFVGWNNLCSAGENVMTLSGKHSLESFNINIFYRMLSVPFLKTSCCSCTLRNFMTFGMDVCISICPWSGHWHQIQYSLYVSDQDLYLLPQSPFNRSKPLNKKPVARIERAFIILSNMKWHVRLSSFEKRTDSLDLWFKS